MLSENPRAQVVRSPPDSHRTKMRLSDFAPLGRVVTEFV